MTEIPAELVKLALTALIAEGSDLDDSWLSHLAEVALDAVLPAHKRMEREQVAADLQRLATAYRAVPAELRTHFGTIDLAETVAVVLENTGLFVARGPQDAPTAPKPPFRVPETLRARRAREAAEHLLTLVDEVRDVMAYFDGQLTALAKLHPTHADALRITYRKLDALLAAPTTPVQPTAPTTGDTETTGGAEGGPGGLDAVREMLRTALREGDALDQDRDRWRTRAVQAEAALERARDVLADPLLHTSDPERRGERYLAARIRTALNPTQDGQ